MSALDAGIDAEKVEQEWNDDILAWGRRGWSQVDRLCGWFVDNGAKLPFPCGAAKDSTPKP